MGLFQKKDPSSGGRTLHLVNKSKSFAYVESYKALRTNLNYVASASGHGTKVIMVVSSMPSEGKSNVTLNLAVTLAQDEKRVLLIDCDLRKGTINRYLRIPRSADGVTDVLTGEVDVRAAIQPYGDLGFDVLPSGQVPPNPSELLGSSKMGQMFKTLRERYDYILCDTPPVNAVTDASALGRYVDGAILVVSHNYVSRESALAAKNQLEANNIPIFGVVLNMYDSKHSGENGKLYSYYNYGYSSDYGYGQTPSQERAERDAKGRENEKE